jgi:beta-lactamase class A
MRAVVLSAVCAALAAVLAQEASPGPATAMQAQLAPLVDSFHGRLGIAVVDLASGETRAAINADERFPTASTIKTAVLVEAWQQIEDGRLAIGGVVELRKEDKVGGAGVLNRMHDGLALTIGDLLHLMIALSDNTATNLLIARVGTSRVNAKLDALGLTNTRLFRPTFRDGRADALPELEREYGLGMSTPREMARLMAAIGRGQVVSAEACERMLATLRAQQDRAMIPRAIPAAPGVQIANKTGTDEEKHPGPDGVRRHVRADAAVVTGPGFGYAIAIFARQVEDTRWGVENEAVTTGARLSRIVYDAYAR